MRTGSSSPLSEHRFMARAVELAIRAEAKGNLPIAAVLVLDGEVVATGQNQTSFPIVHPGRHAETLALAAVPEALANRLPEMTCFTTLEPCLMCFGSLVIHGVARVVFGARDPVGGAIDLIQHLPPYVARKAGSIQWLGPTAPELCEPLWQRIAKKYELWSTMQEA